MPAELDGVLAVDATGNMSVKASYSNFGSQFVKVRQCSGLLCCATGRTNGRRRWNAAAPCAADGFVFLP